MDKNMKNQNNIDYIDPKLTAYALGEIQDWSAKEQSAFEESLKSDPQKQKFIDEIKETAKLIQEDFNQERPPRLTQDQRQNVLSHFHGDHGKPFKKKHARSYSWIWGSGISAIAASLLIFMVIQNWDLGTPKPTPSSLKAAKKPIRKSSPKRVDLSKPIQIATKEMKESAAKIRRKGNVLGTKTKRAQPLSKLTLQDGAPMIRNQPGKLGDLSSRSQRQLLQAKKRLTYRSGAGAPAFPSMGAPSEGDQDHNTEAYDRIYENPFLAVQSNPLSTFSIDVDTASYANMRRFLTQWNQLPPPDSVRIEEMLNYFNYHYAPPTGTHPFAVDVEVASAPWKNQHRLLRIGLKGKEIEFSNRPASNLVFLLDVSGSMRSPHKLPLLKDAIKLLVEQLSENDSVSIVVYAGASGMVLNPTTGDEKEVIMDALDRLQAGGSTNGGAGIKLAYQTAQQNFIKGGINRVILATDGDFNVGTTNQGELTRLIEAKAKTGVFLTVLGFGMGNYKDSTLEKLADKGNGNYAYIDSQREAKKVLVEQVGGTLITIAKDVKIQIDFNPAQVKAYRLIGYENRLLRAEDFHDDKKDAGEIGSGHTVTALYEIVPVGVEMDLPKVDASKYNKPIAKGSSNSPEILTVKLRYKKPDGQKSTLLEVPVIDEEKTFAAASEDFQFAAAVAAFGMKLRGSKYKGDITYNRILEMAQKARSFDPGDYRKEFVDLVKRAKTLSEKSQR